ncbi:antitoxin Xre/MbcA/ParS toxin-binding domain-containing protein [Chitinophaga sp. SYP-B3965]|uniref:antitoxin Xre/MbcA/ParS toxin-binding domain-containing protein n=1 Tax=Chitinophaga sp. SYP-B3965 TaxID=2663120 RepID=UPI00156702A3
MTRSENNRRGKKVVPISAATDLFDNYEQIANLHAVLYTIKEDFVKAGITKGQLSRLKNVLGLDYFTLSNILAITERTIHMKKDDETFSHIISDRIMYVAELYSYGYKIFGSRESFNVWMRQENKYFHGRSPIELLETQVGGKEVENEIYRFEVGTF